MFVDVSRVGTLNSDCCGISPSLGGAASVIYSFFRTDYGENTQVLGWEDEERSMGRGWENIVNSDGVSCVV